tara:strand:+ start:9378 stop:9701 length:324 start_codon:yes stop_codon:yes gene_type:complete
MNIRLEQLIGKRKDRKGEIVEIAWAVDKVFLDDQQVGTIGRFSGASFCPFPEVNDSQAEDIVKAITAIREKEGDFGPCAETHSPIPHEPIDELINEGEEPDEDEEDI